MPTRFQISLPAQVPVNFTNLQDQLSRSENIDPARITHIEVLKRSIDARSRTIKHVFLLDVWIDEIFVQSDAFEPDFKNVSNSREVYIIGAGPAGYFAALKLLQIGLKPVVIERGKDVQKRRRDIAKLNKEQIVNPDSNYCFGEGGAGTYSDGKLYTRSNKRGDVQNVLDLFVHFGASEDIKINARPHIGTNKLPEVIQNMRECIINFGGEIHFETSLTDFETGFNAIQSITINGNEKIKTSSLILATGHSSRMIFEMLFEKGIAIEAKPFALGVRAEHPQHIIDTIQYHCKTRPDYLPPAYYNLVSRELERGVYSFCMCPGGIIAPCSTSPGEIVTNGWSPSKRNNPFANSGIVVEIQLEDLKEFSALNNPLIALDFQKKVEQTASSLTGGGQIAPAQRLVDFVENKISQDLPACSYLPGITSVDLKDLLPNFISEKLQKGFRSFGKKIPTYFTNEAVLVGPESRTSSPIRIPRNPNTMEHIDIKGLYPCGEGAGYAGGIVSAAIDGINCAHQLGL